MTRCLVTGIAGFIGSSIAHGLQRRGFTVRGLDNFSTGKLENIAALGRSVEVIRGDIRDPLALARALQGVDTVYHQAAIASVQQSVDDPVGTYAVNVTGTRRLLEAATRAGVRRLVFASSAAVYGDTVRLPVSELDRPCPLSPYAAHKLECELMLEQAWLNGDLETVSLRYFNVFGPRQSADYAGAIVSFLRAALEPRRGTPITIFGDGAQTRDFIFIEDVVRANLAAMQAEVAGGVFNIGTGRGVTILETARQIAYLAGVDPSFVHRAPRAGDVRHSTADVRYAAAALGFTAATTLREGLAETMTHQLTDISAERLTVAGVLPALVPQTELTARLAS